ncbi:MAG: hypothetical protein RL189_2282 [Pseudomonadota bacterium]|jgi:hypothetical protein
MKSYLKSLPFAAIGLFVAQNAHAAGVNFHFLVKSSGTQIYPCDAGLYDPNADLGESWLSAKYAAYDGNKVTSTTAWNSLYLPANLTANIPPSALKPFKTVALNAPGITAADTSVGATKFGNVIQDASSSSSTALNADELTFNLGSQKYGAKYFIDFCFRDSQVGWLPPTSSSTTPSYQYEITDTVTALKLNPSSDTPAYWANSDLRVRGKIVCDDNIDDIRETIVPDLDGISGSHSSSLLPATGDVELNTVATPVFFTPGSSVGSKTPYLHTVLPTEKKCLIRYIFSETSTDFRLNDLLVAQFAIYLNVKRKY